MIPIDTDNTVQVLQHRWLERWINRGIGALDALGLGATSLDGDDVLREAVRKTGLEDWGDERFIEPMRRGLAAVEECGYEPIARFVFHGNFVRAVVHRLQTEQWFKDHPEAAEIEVKAPIFILGFPRTGTTVLQNLLEQHPNRRALQFWELINPAPVHPDPEVDLRKRISMAERDLAVAYRMAPEMREMHEVTATSYEECWPLFSNSCATLNNDLCHGLQPYGDYLLDFDMRWAYREYKRQLQMLLHREPARRLVLKCPEHLWYLDALLEVFPDACVVWTHREPIDCIASYSSMISLSRRMWAGRIDPAAIGEHITGRFETGLKRAMKARDDADPDRFYDVPFREFITDQVGIVSRLEDHFGLGHGDMAAHRQWLDAKRADSRGSHRYNAAMFGLKARPIELRFEEYIQRYLRVRTAA